MGLRFPGPQKIIVSRKWTDYVRFKKENLIVPDDVNAKEPRGHAWKLWKYVYVQILYVRRSINGFRSENLDHKGEVIPSIIHEESHSMCNNITDHVNVANLRLNAS
ncbi:hypothetical protein I3760_13G080200 [Carya illinoinensis]|nr:hypothetical protein I3760_13G080200 [Carya illinoinensis]